MHDSAFLHFLYLGRGLKPLSKMGWKIRKPSIQIVDLASRCGGGDERAKVLLKI